MLLNQFLNKYFSSIEPEKAETRQDLANGDNMEELDDEVGLNNSLDPDTSLELEHLRLEHLKLQEAQVLCKHPMLLLKQAEKKNSATSRCILPDGRIVVRNVKNMASVHCAAPRLPDNDTPRQRHASAAPVIHVHEVYRKGQDYPIIIDFPNGYPNEDFDNARCDVLQDESSNKMVVTELAGQEYAGSEVKEDELGETFLLTRNRKTGIVRLIQVGRAVLKPVSK